MASQRKPKKAKANIISEREQSERAATAAMEASEEKEHVAGAGPSPAPGASTIKDKKGKKLQTSTPATPPDPAGQRMKYQPGWPGVAQSTPITQDHQRDSPTNQPDARRSGELAAGYSVAAPRVPGAPVTQLDFQAMGVQQVTVRAEPVVTGSEALASSIRDHARPTIMLNMMLQNRAASGAMLDQLSRPLRGAEGVNRFPEQTAGMNARDQGGAAPRPAPQRPPGYELQVNRTPIGDRDAPVQYGNVASVNAPGREFSTPNPTDYRRGYPWTR